MEIQDSEGYIEKPCFEKLKQNKKTRTLINTPFSTSKPPNLASAHIINRIYKAEGTEGLLHVTDPFAQAYNQNILRRHHYTSYLRISNQKAGKMVQWVKAFAINLTTQVQFSECTWWEGRTDSKFCSDLYIHTTACTRTHTPQ